MSDPLVSVVIPLYNGVRHIGEAIESVLSQDYPKLELLVVDDGSQDGGAEVVKRYPQVRLIQQENQGPAVARNVGVREATGDILAFLDADDLWLPGKVRQQVDALLAAPAPCFVICETRLEFMSGNPIPAGYSQRMVETDHPSHLPSALMVKREVFEQVGDFDPQLRSGQDTDWFFRAIEAGIARELVPKTLFKKRIHDTNITGTVAQTRQSMMRNLKASLDRKRSQQSKS